MTKEPLLLHIETATEVCSVALSLGMNILGVEESADGNSHSKHLLPFIERLMKETGKCLEELDGIVVSIGPGSYTGLRIGTSTAKGIAYSLGSLSSRWVPWRVSHTGPRHNGCRTGCPRRSISP